MVRVGDVWDSATDVIAGRAGVLAPIAALAFVVPAAVQSAVQGYGGGTTAAAVASGLIGLVAAVVSLWGQLAVIAVASDPATTRAEAGRLALARLPAGLLVLVILVGLALLLVLPAAVILVAAGFDVMAVTAGGETAMPTLTPGLVVGLMLYAPAAFALLVWAAARLFLVNPVVLNERRAAGAFGRSIALTRGLTWKLIGVALLFGIAWLVAVTAAQAVVFLVLRLVLGSEGAATATFIAAVAGACVTAAWIVVVQVFAARLFAAAGGGGAPGLRP